MSHFTKKELKIISSALFNYMIFPVNKTQSTLELRGKILEMIESYCEHDDCGCESEIFVDNCSKCNKFILRDLLNE